MKSSACCRFDGQHVVGKTALRLHDQASLRSSHPNAGRTALFLHLRKKRTAIRRIRSPLRPPVLGNGVHISADRFPCHRWAHDRREQIFVVAAWVSIAGSCGQAPRTRSAIHSLSLAERFSNLDKLRAPRRSLRPPIGQLLAGVTHQAWMNHTSARNSHPRHRPSKTHLLARSLGDAKALIASLGPPAAEGLGDA